MRSTAGGFCSASVMFIPLLAVPFLAAFGLPQFSPLAASSSAEPSPPVPELGPPLEDPGIGQSDRYTADDIFAVFDETPAETTAADAATASPPTHPFGETTDPFQEFQQEPGLPPSDPFAQQLAGGANAPAEALRDWRTDPPVAEARRDGPSPPAAPPSETVTPGSPVSADAFSEPPAAKTSPREESPPPAPSESPAPPPGASPAARGMEAAVQRLNELGIRDFQFSAGRQPGDFHFACFFSPPDNPQMTQRFEAEASDPLDAVQQVLRQVEDWRKKQSPQHAAR